MGFQDICTGVQTPVLQKAPAAKIQTDTVWSIVATERTLDLQSTDIETRDSWVNGLIMCYKNYVQTNNKPNWAAGIPDKEIEKKVRSKMSYPEKYRSANC